MALMIFLVSAIAALLTLWMTWIHKTGVAPDSMIYISMAHHLAAGKGASVYLALFSETSDPIAAWPPAYAAILAVPFTLFKIHPVETAWILNLTLLGANLYVVGRILYEETSSRVAALIAMLVLVFNIEWITMSLWILSEPAYLFFINAGLWMLMRSLRSGNSRLLIFAALLTSVVPMLRYIGAAFIGTGALATLFLWKGNVKAKFKNATIFWIDFVDSADSLVDSQ